MTEFELAIARKAFTHALATGAPGLSDGMRQVVVNNAILRLRHQLNIPAPRIAPAHTSPVEAP